MRAKQQAGMFTFSSHFAVGLQDLFMRDDALR